MTEKIKVLYVDDEEDNLVGFKATFRRDFEVMTSSSAAQAMGLLDKHPDIRVIFCDQRMPAKTGVDFFEEVKSAYPLPVRIIITAYADIESVIAAVNRGQIFRYIRKPWIPTDISSAIEEASKFYVASSMLAVRNKELELAYAELDKFAYSVSHDLRGPLSGILGGIDIARDMHCLEEIRELLAMMEKSVFKLDAYISSMHDYYSSRRGELKITDIDFHAVGEELRDIYRVALNSEKIALSVQVDQPEFFRSDEVVLKMILNNLFTNAIKYQKKSFDGKKIDVAISVHNSIADILISDTGIGIPESHFEEIFNLFSRATSQRAGSGFGLYNAKAGLVKLGGDIQVSSVVGEGTTFTLTIPSK